MRPQTKFVLVAVAFTSAIALSACGDANVGSHGEFKTAGGDPSGDPAATGGGGGGSSGGGGGGGGGGGTTTGTGTTGTSGGFSITLANSTLDSEVMATNTIPITINATGGFTGSVNLTSGSLPTGVTAVFSPASVSLASGTGTSTLTITVPSNTTPNTTPTMINVNGDGGGGATATTPFAFTIQRAITIVIPQNVEATPNAFGTNPIVVKAGTVSAANPFVVNFKNLDTSKATGHEVHSSNTGNNGGFFHGTANIMPNQTNGSDGPRTVTVASDYPFYCHGETDSNGVQNKPDNVLSFQ